jgi:hypothetical protein
MNEPQDGRDLVSLLYVLGGIPLMVAFFVVFFTLVKACDLPG